MYKSILLLLVGLLVSLSACSGNQETKDKTTPAATDKKAAPTPTKKNKLPPKKEAQKETPKTTPTPASESAKALPGELLGHSQACKCAAVLVETPDKKKALSVWTLNNSGNWQSGPSMPSSITLDGILYAGNKLYFTPKGVLAQTDEKLRFYDLNGKKWSKLPNLPLLQATLSPLPDGSWLAIGGNKSSSGRTPSSDVYHLSKEAKAWTPKTSMPDARMGHQALLLNNGKIFVVGGDDEKSADRFEEGKTFGLAATHLYDPKTDKWTSGGQWKDASTDPTALVLPNNNVLLVGGSLEPVGTQSAFPHLWSSGSFKKLSRLDAGTQCALTTLTDGRVLVSGGHKIVTDGAVEVSHNKTFLIDPATGAISNGPDLKSARGNHLALEISPGQILVEGGRTEFPPNDNKPAATPSPEMLQIK